MFYILGVFISSISQIMLKKSANTEYDSKIKEYFNTKVILAYTIFFGVTLISSFCLRYITLSQSIVFESLGYVFITILGRVFLKERMNSKMKIGMFLIIIGTIIFSI